MRTPQRYGVSRLLGFKAYKAWNPIGQAVQEPEAAKRLCVQYAHKPLLWEVAVRTPSGNPLWHGYPEKGARAGDTYQVSPDEARVREDIPGAEFVSPDPLCTYYIEPQGTHWAVCSMMDLEGRDSFEVMMMTGGSSEQDGADSAKLWNFFEKRFDEKAAALSYGRYLWGRRLVRHNSPPVPTSGRLRERIRGWAARWL